MPKTRPIEDFWSILADKLYSAGWTRGVTQSLRHGGRRPPISQDLEAGGRNMFVRMDLSLKYSQKRNFFHFFEQKKKQHFQKQGVDAPHAPSPRIYAPGLDGYKSRTISQQNQMTTEKN